MLAIPDGAALARGMGPLVVDQFFIQDVCQWKQKPNKQDKEMIYNGVCELQEIALPPDFTDHTGRGYTL